MQKLVKFLKTGLLACLLVPGATGVLSLQAQTAPKASYNKTTQVLSLDVNGPFAYMFELDIRPMNFSSKQKADEFFSNWTTELVSFQVDFEKRTASVMLKTRLKRDWGVKEWNEYLAQLPKQ